MFREHVCYCQVCACKEFAKELAKKCKLKCPVCQREADRIVVKDAADDERVPALRRCKSAETVREELEEEILGMRRVVVPVQRDPPNQTVAEGARNAQKGLARDRYFEALHTIRKLLKETPAVQGAKVPGQQESINRAIAKGKQNTQRGDSRKSTYEKTKAAFHKLEKALSASTAVGIPVQQAPSDQTVVEDTWTLRRVPLLHRCESATFSWDKQCPFCPTTQDIDHESRCVFIRSANCVVLRHLL